VTAGSPSFRVRLFEQVGPVVQAESEAANKPKCHAKPLALYIRR
jgi:hypothetical protein